MNWIYYKFLSRFLMNSFLLYIHKLTLIKFLIACNLSIMPSKNNYLLTYFNILDILKLCVPKYFNVVLLIKILIKLTINWNLYRIHLLINIFKFREFLEKLLLTNHIIFNKFVIHRSLIFPDNILNSSRKKNFI